MSYKSELKGKYYPRAYDLQPDFRQVTLKLELTNICNHRCLTCPHSKQTRPGRFMDPALAKRLIREAAQLHVEKLALFLNGESFLVKDLDAYVRYGKEMGIPFIFLTTNGSVAAREQLAAVMDAGLDSLKFSINAADARTYRRVHGRDDFDKVMENLRFVRAYRDRNGLHCRILAGCVLTDETKHQMDEYSRTVGALADDYLFMKPDNFGGYMVEELPGIYREDDGFSDPRVFRFEDKRLPCPLVFNSANVTCEGYLTLCCSEALNYMVTEDLNQMSLLDAWNSPRMQEIRRRHLRQDVAGTQCQICIANMPGEVKPLNADLLRRSLPQKPEGESH